MTQAKCDGSAISSILIFGLSGLELSGKFESKTSDALFISGESIRLGRMLFDSNSEVERLKRLLQGLRCEASHWTEPIRRQQIAEAGMQTLDVVNVVQFVSTILSRQLFLGMRMLTFSQNKYFLPAWFSHLRSPPPKAQIALADCHCLKQRLPQSRA